MSSQWREADEPEENSENKSKSPIGRALALLFSTQVFVKRILSHLLSINHRSLGRIFSPLIDIGLLFPIGRQWGNF